MVFISLTQPNCCSICAETILMIGARCLRGDTLISDYCDHQQENVRPDSEIVCQDVLLCCQSSVEFRVSFLQCFQCNAECEAKSALSWREKEGILTLSGVSCGEYLDMDWCVKWKVCILT